VNKEEVHCTVAELPIWLLLTLVPSICPTIYIYTTLSSFTILKKQKYNYPEQRKKKMILNNYMTQDGAVECRIV
jgi:hypothetical protein